MQLLTLKRKKNIHINTTLILEGYI